MSATATLTQPFITPSMFDLFDEAFQDGANWAACNDRQTLTDMPAEELTHLDGGIKAGVIRDRDAYVAAWRAGCMAKWLRLAP